MINPLKTWISLAALAITVAGCGEMVTYSKQSRDRGAEYYKAGQYTEAEGAFRDAVRQNPRDFRSHYYLGQLAEKRGQYTAAVTSYRKSLAVQPLSLDAEESGPFRHQTIVDLARPSPRPTRATPRSTPCPPRPPTIKRAKRTSSSPMRSSLAATPTRPSRRTRRR
jgi:tetratricopeptide (TPR) repeat protein